MMKHYEFYFDKNEKLIGKESEIQLAIRKNILNTIDFEDLDLFCKNEWKNLIFKAINKIKNEVINRETKGSEFADNLIQLNKIKENLVDLTNTTIEKLQLTFEIDIMDEIVPIVKEKVTNEKYIIKLYSRGLLYGGIIGFIVGLLVGILLYYAGFS